jgi:hypothetical protein
MEKDDVSGWELAGALGFGGGVVLVGGSAATWAAGAVASKAALSMADSIDVFLVYFVFDAVYRAPFVVVSLGVFGRGRRSGAAALSPPAEPRRGV